MAVVGLVAEGLHDYPLLECVATHLLPEHFERPFKFKRLQPDEDASNGGHPDGGWPRVIGWMNRYSSSRLGTFFVPIEEDDEPCDVIIVHLDGDAADHCLCHAGEPRLANGATAIDRVRALERLSCQWLSPTPNYAKRLAYAFPVMDTEAWIMAAIDDTGTFWETRLDAKPTFRSLKPTSKKVADHYTETCAIGPADINKIRLQSQSFQEFERALKACQL